MPHLTSADKRSFKENGCLIVRDALSSAQIQAAQDALWTGIEADRDDPATWVEAGPRTPVPAHHPAIHATVHESPLFAMMEEMVGEGQLNPGSAGPALVYPAKDKAWSLPERGHLDGYYTPTNGVPEGTVGYMTINVTIYVEDIDAQGGCFTYWPGSHNVAYDYFKTHSLLSVQGRRFQRRISRGNLPPRVRICRPSWRCHLLARSALSHGFQERQSQHPHGPHRPLLAQRHQRYPL